MSTKTTFKRVALVAVAALGFGLLSVAPSSAAQQADTLTLSAVTTANSTGTIGTAVSTTLTQSFFGNNGDTMSVMAAIVSYPTGFAVAPTLVLVHDGIGGINSLQGTDRVQLNDTATVSGVVTGATTVSFTPTGSGTYVFSFTPYRGTSTDQANGVTAVASSAAVVTWTVTVAAAVPADTTSTAWMTTGTTKLTSGSGATAVTTSSIATGSTAVATIVVTPMTSGEATVGSTAMSVVLTGAGQLGISAAVGGTPVATGRSLTSSATYGASTSFVVAVFGDGTAGLATVTITLGSVVVATKTVTFSGAAASAVATVVIPVITSGSGAEGKAAVTAIVKDAAGNVVSGKKVYAVSGTTTVFASASDTTSSAGKATFTFTGLAAGTSTVTVQDVAAGSTATWTAAAVSVRAGTDIASTVTMTLDKATYTQGEAAVLTVTIKDAAGNAVFDTAYDAFSTAPTASRTIAGTLPEASVSTGSSLGTKTYKINVPTTSGAFTISGLDADEAVVSVTATVSQSAAEIANADAIAAAADAAAEATDAANAATDAANAAAEAADAATAAAQDAADAVATLGTQVAELIDGLKAQIAAQKAAITALTNLVIKIQKKLKA